MLFLLVISLCVAAQSYNLPGVPQKSLPSNLHQSSMNAQSYDIADKEARDICRRNDNYLPGETNYYEFFRNLGHYGSQQSVDEWILGILCTCINYRSYHYSLSLETRCVHLDIDMKYFYWAVKNEQNQTFSSRLQPFITNIGENINRVGCNALKDWDFWYKNVHVGYDWRETRRYEELREWLFGLFFSLSFESEIENLKRDFGYYYLKRWLKSTNVDGAWNIDHNKTKHQDNRGLIFDAINTVFGKYANVNLYELFELVLRHENDDAKEMLKLVLTKHINTYLTKDRITCYLQELTRNKLLDYHTSGKTERNTTFNIQNSLVRELLDTHISVLDNYGPMVYVDLAHAVVDELDLVNIAAVVNTQYKNILKIVNWVDKINWMAEVKAVENRINSSVPELKAMLCGVPNMSRPIHYVNGVDYEVDRTVDIGYILRSVNISSTCLDDDLDLIVKQLFNFFPLILEKIKSVTIDTWRFGYWTKPFEITDYIESNTGIIGRLLNYKMKDDVGLVIGNTLKYIMDTSEDIFADMEIKQVLDSLSKYLSQKVFLTTEDQERIMEPIKELGNFLTCLYCNAMLNIFKVEVTCSPCVP